MTLSHRVSRFVGPCWLALVLVLLVRATPAASGQTYLDATGVPSFSTQFPVEGGFINISNGNLHLEIPLAEPAQRGAVALGSKFIYDSRLWQIVQGYSWQLTQNTTGDNTLPTTGGWRYSNGFSGTTYSYSVSNYCTVQPTPPYYGSPQQYPVSTTYSPTFWIDPQGTQHRFSAGLTSPPSSAPPPNCNGPGGSPMPPQTFTHTADADAADGSGYHLYINDQSGPYYRILDKSGNQVCCGVLQDTNGNVISNSNGSIVDTGSRQPILFSHNGNLYYFDVLGAGGKRNRYTVTTTSINVSTNFHQQAVTEFTGTASVVSSIQLPDGSSYQFQYDSGTTPGHYGEVIGITLPQGGAVGYGYGIFNDSYQNANHWLSTRTTTDGTWSFSPSVINQCSGSGTGCKEAVRVTSPSLDDTVYTQSLVGGAWTTSTDHWSGSSSNGGTLLSTTSAALTYNQTYSPFGQFVIKRSESTTLSDIGMSATKEYDYDSATGSQLLALKEFDFTPCPAGTSVPNRQTGYVFSTQTGFVAANILDRVSQETVTDCAGAIVSQIRRGYDEVAVTSTQGLPQHVAVTSSRGNMTTMSPWLNTSNSFLSTTAAYDDAGSITSSTDENSKRTTYGYEATDSFITAVNRPVPSSNVALNSSGTVDASTGLPSTNTDPNGTVQRIPAYDPLLRPAEVDVSDAGGSMVGRTTYSYYPSALVTHIYHNAGTYTDSEQLYDGYGRPSRTAVSNGQSTNAWYQQDTCYGANGKVSFKSYSYSGSGFGQAQVCSGAGDSYVYDSFGRVTVVTHSDGSKAKYIYRGRATEFIDENNVSRISQVDALGRTTAVCEISSNTNMPSSGTPQACGLDIAGTGFLTTYSYGLASHLTNVTQGGQTRSFQTDSLGRQTQTQEPEAGSTSYTYAYNPTGLLVTRVRPQANQTSSALTTTTTQYDTLGRVVNEQYNDGTPNKTFTYDVPTSWAEAGSQTNLKGRLSFAWRTGTGGSAGTIYGYDANGNVVTNYECTPSGCGNPAYDRGLSYGYDWTGTLTSESDGAGVTYYYGRSLAGEVTGITSSLADQNDPGTLVSSVQNTALGPTSYVLGNGWAQALQYDALGRVLQGSVCSNGVTNVACNGGNKIYGFSSFWSGSRVYQSSDSVMGTSNAYGYDEFNRLTSNNINNGSQVDQYVYDRWGNRWQQNISGSGSGYPSQYSFDSNNHLQQASYDAAGNMIVDPQGTHYGYDADGNLIQVGTGSGATYYVYDALNQRVRVQRAGSGGTWEFVFDQNGNRVSVWNAAQETFSNSVIYWDGMPLGIRSGGATYFQHGDWLGTPRFYSSPQATVLTAFTSSAFGEGETAHGPDPDWNHFAGLDWDGESGLYHAQYRQYNAIQGRWMSPDPYQGSYDSTSPQTFNRYAYALNSPLSNVDPSGLSTAPIVPCGTSGTTFCMGDGTSAAGSGDPSGLLALLINIGDILSGLFGGSHHFNGSLQLRPSAPNNGSTTCVGPGRASAVGPHQAPYTGHSGALYSSTSKYSIAGGAMGTAAVQRGFLGLGKATLRQYGGQIFISFADNGAIVNSGGPAGPYTVSDVGDPNIRNNRIDIYRWPSGDAANNFGNNAYQTTITFPTATGGSCPAGWVTR